jgi:threonine synthase
VVCTLTGHGLKDPDAGQDTARAFAGSPIRVPAELGAVLKAMGF